MSTDDLLAKLSADVRPIVRRLIAEPLVPLDQLREDASRHLELLEQEQHRNEFLDLDQAKSLHDRCLALLERAESASTEAFRRLAQVAARYFVLEDDADDDLSFDGLSDDESVITAVEQLLSTAE